jgi:hypothetical protein
MLSFALNTVPNGMLITCNQTTYAPTCKVIKNIVMKKLLLLPIVAMMVSCSNDAPQSFSSSPEALKACQSVLSSFRTNKSYDIKILAEMTAHWQQVQDSAYICLLRDSTIADNADYNVVFFAVADTIREVIMERVLAKPRTMDELMTFKVLTTKGRKNVQKSDDFKRVCRFYDKADKQPVIADIKNTIAEYKALLAQQKQIRSEQDLMVFIKAEDRCFRSLMKHLSKVSQEDLQMLTDRTAVLIDALYRNTAKNLGAKDNNRVMLILTMRINRRIIQNAQACVTDVIHRKKLTEQQAGNYRWMLMQPFMNIDGNAMSALTDEQYKQLGDIAKRLPQIMIRLDGIKNASHEEMSKLNQVLVNILFKSYISAIL